MRPQSIIWLTLSVLCLGASVWIVQNKVLARDSREQLLELLTREELPDERLVMLYPAEPHYKMLPELHLYRDKLLLFSIHTRQMPLHILRGVSSLYLIQQKESPSDRTSFERTNIAQWPRQQVGESKDYVLYKLTPAFHSIVDDFSRFTVFSFDGNQKMPASWEHGRFQYGDKTWQAVSLLEGDIAGAEETCIGVHPLASSPLQLLVPLRNNFARASIYFAMRRSGSYSRGLKVTVKLAVLDQDGRVLRRAAKAERADRLNDWRTVEVPIQGGKQLQIDLAVNGDGRNHLCLQGDLVQ